MWVTIFYDPLEDTLRVDAFMALKIRIQAIAREIHPNSQTEVILERADGTA